MVLPSFQQVQYLLLRSCGSARGWGLLSCGSGGIAQGEDLWPDLSEAAVKGAARDRLAAFLVVDGHLDPGDGLVATAEARLAWREPDQHGTLSADAAPALARLSEPVRSCALSQLRKILDAYGDDGWQGWNLSRAEARRLIGNSYVRPNPCG